MTSRSPRPRLAPTMAVAAIAVGLLATACSGGDGDAETTSPTTARNQPATSAPATTAPPSTSLVPGSPEDKAAVLKTIDQFWEELRPALDPPDPERPALFALLTGEAKLRVNQYIRQYQANGRYSRRRTPGANPHRSSDPEITGNDAIVYECRLDDAITYDKSGKVLNADSGTDKYKTVLIREGNRWLIASQNEPNDPQAEALCSGL